MDQKYILDLLEELMGIPSVTGDTRKAMNRIKEEFEKFGLTVCINRKGAMYVVLPGKDDQDQVLINAHMDTLGSMIREIEPNGTIRVTNIGGCSWNTYEGENLLVHTLEGKTYSGTLMYEKSSVHCFPEDARETVRTEWNMKIRLDEDIHSAEDVKKLGISVGDFVSYDTRTVITESGFVKSRYLDDKSCVAVMIGVLKYMVENKIQPLHTTLFFVANYEELGHGVSHIPSEVAEMLSVDIGTVGAGHTADEHSVSICAKDSRTPYDFAYRRKLELLAKKHEIGYKVDLHHRYGSDASMSVVRGADVNFACIGPGVDATHHYERTHVDALMNTAKLILVYLTEEAE